MPNRRRSGPPRWVGQLVGTIRDLIPPDPAAVLRFVVEQAVRAPSSHNTQPWRYRIEGDRLKLYADRSRALPVNDPHDRELTISCGASLFTARVAAAHAGARLTASLVPERDDADLLAIAALAPDPAMDDRLFPAVARRRTHRKGFAARGIDGSALEAMAEAAAMEGARLDPLDDERRAAFAQLVAEGDRMLFSSVSWRRELAAWMRPRAGEEGLIVAPGTRFLVRHLDVGGSVARKDAKLAATAPLVAILATERDSVADWLRAGQALQRLLLTATNAGLQASYLNQPLQVDALRPRVAGLLGKDGCPQLAIRFGHPSVELPPSPRRPVEAVVE